MILSNVEIFQALDEGRLVIEPQPFPRYSTVGGDHCPYDTHSIDLRLGEEISIPQPGTYAYDHTQTGNLSAHISRNSEKRRLRSDQPFRLDNGRFVLGITLESVGLPIQPNCQTCLGARIEGKSSRARCGLLIHFTAPTVHPGWNGPLVLEMINLGPSPILLTPGMYIAQLIVEEVSGCPNESESQFQNQTSPDGIARDGDLSRSNGS
jgi:dCTP deaminase